MTIPSVDNITDTATATATATAMTNNRIQTSGNGNGYVHGRGNLHGHGHGNMSNRHGSIMKKMNLEKTRMNMFRPRRFLFIFLFMIIFLTINHTMTILFWMIQFNAAVSIIDPPNYSYYFEEENTNNSSSTSASSTSNIDFDTSTTAFSSASRTSRRITTTSTETTMETSDTPTTTATTSDTIKVKLNVDGNDNAMIDALIENITKYQENSNNNSSFRSIYKQNQDIPSHLLPSMVINQDTTASTTLSTSKRIPINNYIHNVLYFNSLFQPHRRKFMERQFQTILQVQPQQPQNDINHYSHTIPFRRVELLSGSNRTECDQRGQQCLDRLKMASTYRWMLHSPSFYLNGNNTYNHNNDNNSNSDNSRDSDTITINPKQTMSTLIWHQDDLEITNIDFILETLDMLQQTDKDSNPYSRWRVMELQCDMKSTVSSQEPFHAEAVAATATHHYDISSRLVRGHCNRTNGILWRNSNDLITEIRPHIKDTDHFIKTAINLSPILSGKTFCLVAQPSYCKVVDVPISSSTNNEETTTTSNSNMTVVSSSSSLLSGQYLVSRIESFRNKVPLERIRQEVQEARYPTMEQRYRGPYEIDRIYYSNLDKNIMRRSIMEGWLQPLYEQKKLKHYKRISATKGIPNVCAEGKNSDIRCIGVSGISQTLVNIINHENITTTTTTTGGGITMVLEDDYVMTDDNFDRLQESLRLVPDDWDIIRFDCWGEFQKLGGFTFWNSFVIQTNNSTNYPDHPEKLPCAGAYSMLWRGDPNSISKLKEMWSRIPYNGVDCVIAETPSVKSYCINIGLGDEYKIESEITDIVKI